MYSSSAGVTPGKWIKTLCQMSLCPAAANSLRQFPIIESCNTSHICSLGFVERSKVTGSSPAPGTEAKEFVQSFHPEPTAS